MVERTKNMLHVAALDRTALGDTLSKRTWHHK
jgi:hypothetical protein